MLAVAELRNAEADASTAIVAKVVGEIVIQIVGLRTVIVDDKFQIMSDATARGIDAAVVIKLSHEIGGGIHLITVGEGLRVQITVDGRTYRIILNHLTAIEHETVVLAMQGGGLLVVDGIERHLSVAVGIADIHRHSKGEVEHAVDDTVRTLIERLRAILIDEGLFCAVSTVVVLLTGDRLLRIPHRSCHHAAET